MDPLLQGDIYLAALDPTRGHEQGGLRPVVILQNDMLNRNLSTVIIAPITKSFKRKDILTTYFLDKKIHKLKEDSVVLLFQIRSIDKSRLLKKVAVIKEENFKEILNQLKLVF